MNKLRSNKGFTLLELMISLAVIGILLTLAIPAYSSYQKSAYATLLNQSARQMAVSLAAFNADNPGATTAPAITGAGSLANYGFLVTDGTTPTIPIYTSTTNWTVQVDGTSSWGLAANTASITSAGVFTKAVGN
jgi:prepilin-type N-terminal cleavage/methylation domain-containing protein